MNYQQATDFLFSQLASYQDVGIKAYNKSLDKTFLLLEKLDNPHIKFRSVHVAGTNGKGSSCHMLASVLQEAGYKTGLYTSPHLKSFTERIKINGNEVSEQFVIDFVEQNKDLIEELKPSFFEMTTIMAFKYFADNEVDIAIIETGLGGRLDSTNVIYPEVCLITSISLDHQYILGDTVEKIALEKAGIIKHDVPVVLGLQVYDDLDLLLNAEAKSKLAPVFFASPHAKSYDLDLKGNYQQDNVAGVLKVIEVLVSKGFNISENNIKSGLKNVVGNTGLKGRWQILSNQPLVICDTAHNAEAFFEVLIQLKEMDYENLYMILGFVEDKNIDGLLSTFPKDVNYIFTSGKNNRLLKSNELCEKAKVFGLIGKAIDNVNSAIGECKKTAASEDVIFIGGSNFVVAEINDL